MSVETSEKCDELFAAMAKAQATVANATKDKENPGFRGSKYADLASVWEACREPLTSNGLSVTQWSSSTDGGVTLTTVLGHSSGQWMRSTLVVPLANTATAQQIGSALTYARRYMLSAVAGVAPDDDDGNKASEAAPKETQRRTTKSEPKAKHAKRSEANDATRKNYAKYVIAAQKNGHPMRDIAEFLAEASGRTVENIAANESSWDAIPDRIWEKACSAVIEAFASASKPAEREPGEDDDWNEDPTVEQGAA